MRRPGLLLAALGCLLVAVLLAPPAPEQEGASVLGAVGRSMGGVRVFAIDAIFLRAEAQRRAGRVDEAAALYETALEMDPANEAATIFLVNLIADDLMGQEPDPEARLGWWRRARALLQGALERHPDSPSLHARFAGLLLEVRRVGSAVSVSDEAAVEVGRLALEHLVVAARATGTLPRLGRVHLIQFPVLAPEVAAEALAAGDDRLSGEVLATGHEILVLRAEVLGELRFEEDDTFGLADILRAGLEAVEAVRKHRAGQISTSVAQARIEACRALLPDWRLPARLESLLGE